MSEIKVDVHLPKDIANTAAHAARLEALGYDGIWTGESKQDSFLHLAAAAPATTRVTLGNEIAVAFSRTPMTLAQLGWDMQVYTRGRFILGLGSQVKAHIERRFSMPWGHPAPRMREMVLAIRAIWDTWRNGTPLDFRGEFYQHTLMTPFFTPEPHDYALAPIYLAGLGMQMTEVAGEVADGFFMHPFTTPQYLEQISREALARGRARVGKTLDGFDIGGLTFVAAGRTDAEISAAIEGCKARIAFYASTPQYLPVLAMHGFETVHEQCRVLAREGRWSDMDKVIPDELIDLMVVAGTPAAAGRELVNRLGGLVTRLSIYSPYPHDEAMWTELIESLRSA